ncbi:MAG: hypothetical protein ACPG4T_17815, partial [Nannocystaceae bacterium]
ALRAEAEAAKEQLAAANAANKELQDQLDTPPEAEDDIGAEKELADGEKGPVSITALKLTPHQAAHGHARGRHQLKASVELTVNEVKKGGLYAKATCVLGEEVAVDVMTLGNQYGDFGKLAQGDKSTIEKTFFARDGLASNPSRCQVTIDYGLQDFSLHLQDYCWDGKGVKPESCGDTVAAKASADAKFLAYDFTFEASQTLMKESDEDPRQSVFARYKLQVNEDLDHAIHMYLKTSCKVGDKHWVEINPDYPHVKPFHFKPGEMMPFGHGQFIFNPLPGEPEMCQLSVQVASSFSKPAETVKTVCWKGGEIADEPCAPPPEGQPEPAPVTKDSILIDHATAKWLPGLGGEGVRMNLLFAGTVKAPVEKYTRIYAQASCDGTEDKQHSTSVDLSQLDVGESALLAVPAFLSSALPAEPKSCEVNLKAGPRADATVEIGKLCVKGADVKVGACKTAKKKKKKAAKKDDKGKEDAKKDDKKDATKDPSKSGVNIKPLKGASKGSN